ncbi:hypothetical protein AB0O57_35135 [Streptomyces sp. NPDC091201]|uniref:hypothetical protein n=1 Tax=Streptomyces sp. NPDC091201 TaxID=3155190 RepID=UPI003430B159
MDEISKVALKEWGPSRAALLDYLVFRNDWKVGSAFRRIMGMPDVASAFLKDFRHAGNELDVFLNLEPTRVSGTATPGYLFDAAIYANRLYQATSEGLFEAYFNPLRPRDEMPLTQFLEYETRCVAAHYMAVNASAEDRGLWFSPIALQDPGDYAYWEDGLEDPFREEGYGPPVIRRSRGGMEQVAEYSAACSPASRHLLNYTEAPMPGFLKARDVQGRSHENAQFEEWMVTGYDPEMSIADLTYRAVTGGERPGSESRGFIGAETRDLEVLGNSNHRLLVREGDALEVLNISAFRNHNVAVKKNVDFGSVPSRSVGQSEILSTRDLASGFAIELFDSVSVMTVSGVFSVYGEPAARIRTFRQSRRYKDVMAIVGERDLALAGFIEFPDLVPSF